MSVSIFDAHNHLQDPHLRPHLEQILNQTQFDGGSALPGAMNSEIEILGGVVNGTHPDDWSAVENICLQNPNWMPSFGVHPWRVDDLPGDWECRLRDFIGRNHHRVGIGEIGLDRWKTRENFQLQREIFAQQWHIAVEFEVPITVHCLRTWGEILDFLKVLPPSPRGFLLHAYGGSGELVQPLAKLGAWFSFNGSFLAHERKLETFRHIPLDRLLIESDAPSMGPECPPELSLPPLPDGTAVHHPASICMSLLGLSDLLQIPYERLAEQLCENHRRFF